MCGTDCELLNIVRMNVDEIYSIRATPSIHKATPLTEAYIKHTYSDVFSGLGCIGDPVYIKLNTSVRLVQSGIRQDTVNKTQNISKRTREMINDGYLEPVNEPTPWCSPMTVDRGLKTPTQYRYAWTQSEHSIWQLGIQSIVINIADDMLMFGTGIIIIIIIIIVYI